jgi:hypothetical protein
MMKRTADIVVAVAATVYIESPAVKLSMWPTSRRLWAIPADFQAESPRASSQD